MSRNIMFADSIISRHHIPGGKGCRYFSFEYLPTKYFLILSEWAGWAES